MSNRGTSFPKTLSSLESGMGGSELVHCTICLEIGHRARLATTRAPDDGENYGSDVKKTYKVPLH